MPDFALYIDPTSAGLGLQMLLAGVVGSLVAVRMFWARVFSIFRRTKPDTEDPITTSDETLTATEEEA